MSTRCRLRSAGEIATQVAELSKAVPVVHAVMNNNYEEQGQRKAKALTKLLKRRRRQASALRSWSDRACPSLRGLEAYQTNRKNGSSEGSMDDVIRRRIGNPGGSVRGDGADVCSLGSRQAAAAVKADFRFRSRERCRLDA